MVLFLTTLGKKVLEIIEHAIKGSYMFAFDCVAEVLMNELRL